MRKFNQAKIALAIASMAALNIAAPMMASAWGDNEGGRRGYTVDQINHGVLDGKIVFNSIIDSVDGSEKNFVSAQKSTDDPKGTWQGNDITVENGQEYTIRLYVHNNNRWGYQAVAEDTKVAISIPQESSTQVQVNGFITSSNATPSKYWDYVNFNSSNAFHLEYVYGSALLYNNGIGLGGLKLSDEVVTAQGGTLIGYDALDGRVPGCYSYDNYVTIKVKAVYDTDYTINNQVRLNGTKEWGNYVYANVGDKVDFQVEYTNTSQVNETQTSVTIKSILPANLKYVAGTTRIWNANNSGTYLSPDGAITAEGLRIGTYLPGANAFLRFTAEVVDDSLVCGDNTLVDWTQGGVGDVVIQDYASVIVNKGNCTPSNDAKEYQLQVRYLYEDGTTAAETYSGSFLAGDHFVVDSPEIDGFTPDYRKIEGTMGEQSIAYTVTYFENPDQTDEPTFERTDEETPDEPTPEPIPDEEPQENIANKLPSTGPVTVTGALIGTGSVMTAGGYYVLSKRQLR